MKKNLFARFIISLNIALVALSDSQAQDPGSLDTSFVASTDGAAVATLAVQTDGKIIVGGYFTQVDGAPHSEIARLNADGTLDNSFNGNISNPNASEVLSVAVQADGKLLLGGFFRNGVMRSNFLRLNADGSFDTAFNNSVSVDGDYVQSVAVQPDGKILLGGSFTTVDGTARTDVARLNADGSLDMNFTANTESLVAVNIVAVRPDGSILLGGSFTTINGIPHNGIARLNPDGNLDNSYNAKVAGAVGTIAVQSDGKIVVGGSFSAVNDTPRDNIARLNGDGTLDTAFDPSTSNGPNGTQVSTVAVQPGGKIVLGGHFTAVNRTPRTNIARLNDDGTLDTGFNASAGGSDNSAVGVIVALPDSKLILGGTFTEVDGTGSSRIARLFGQTLAAQSQNISTRLRVLIGDNVLIGGFIITGNTPKKVMLRAIGPSLPVAGALADPTLELHLPDGSVVTNDNWKTNDQTGQSQESDIRATTIPPTNDLESAIVQTLPPGGYTAIVRGKGDTTGLGLVEAYDLDPSSLSKLANISTRGFVDTGDNVMIGGFILGPPSAVDGGKVMVRAIGPSLPVSGALADPTLELHNGNGEKIASNDNWKIDDATGQSQEAEIRATTIPPSDDFESAIVTTLPPGNYTAIVAGKDGGTGIGLVEAYNLE